MKERRRAVWDFNSSKMANTHRLPAGCELVPSPSASVALSIANANKPGNDEKRFDNVLSADVSPRAYGMSVSRVPTGLARPVTREETFRDPEVRKRLRPAYQSTVVEKAIDGKPERLAYYLN